ncbi:nucleotidyltransferase [Virgibacillus chiguensis]|uniref:tRNA(Met) cytidine acetate ligase n=1 Tax=Virgibacillus chiguensis TaxID=411959 RepID=A0A1M5NFU4_9BACI|nr:nucleotidyltransferase [Virgibacillus chiguensis]SHG88380.1 Predicted nucleotidyltransferase [Virgibacillus chiguensis]
MNACGLIVEYNPFHNGHVYHVQHAKKLAKTDCIIAVMSGSFLQRGEPAMIDKFHRAKAALKEGVDIVIELPYTFAVQSSELFAKGAVLALHALQVSSICFGSESGDINHFKESYQKLTKNMDTYQVALKQNLNRGLAFPEASKNAYEIIGLSSMNLTQPNNILGFSYLKTIYDYHLPIQPLTIQRTQSGYHDKTIYGSIASATSIREAIQKEDSITASIRNAIPQTMYEQLITYKRTASTWHTWEAYFPLLHYRASTMSAQELSLIQGVDEGLEYRIKKTAKHAHTFQDWMEKLKTKRYTWTRLQRMCVHILTNTKKSDIEALYNLTAIPYVRILGFTKQGQKYLHERKKTLVTPIIHQMSRNMHPMLQMEEKASNAYYSILPIAIKQNLLKQERSPLCS